MELGETLRGIGENIRWEKPRGVGTARVSSVQKPHHDMVFLDLGDMTKDLTASEFVFTPPNLVREGDVVEVFIRESRFQSAKDHQLGLSRKCSVAIRRFSPKTFGKILPEDKKQLLVMFNNPQNVKDPLSSHAFYRKFMKANLVRVGSGDIQSPGQNL